MLLQPQRGALRRVTVVLVQPGSNVSAAQCGATQRRCWCSMCTSGRAALCCWPHCLHSTSSSLQQLGRCTAAANSVLHYAGHHVLAAAANFCSPLCRCQGCCCCCCCCSRCCRGLGGGSHLQQQPALLTLTAQTAAAPAGPACRKLLFRLCAGV
jgi:hypothetical protein